MNNKVLYKDDQNVAIMGVCAGLADYLEVRVDYVRLVTVLLLLFTGGIVLIIYIVLGLALPTKSAVMSRKNGPFKHQTHHNFKTKNDKKSDYTFDQDDYSFDEDEFKY